MSAAEGAGRGDGGTPADGAADGVEALGAPTRRNDALVYGEVSDAILDRKVEMAVSHAGSRTLSGRWKNWPKVTNPETKPRRNYDGTVLEWLTLLSHHVAGEKDGFCWLGGAVVKGERKAQAVAHLDWLILDIDVGQSIEAIKAKLIKLGLFAVLYTTHSHMKPESTIKRDALVKFAQKPEPTAADAIDYLTNEKRYQPWVLDGATMGEPYHDDTGVMVKVFHKPMPKFRVCLLLRNRFIIAKRGGTQAEAIREWKERYAGASRLLGAFYDRSCTDPSRLFFTPRHPNGETRYSIEVLAGDTLDINTVERVTAADEREEAMDPMQRAAKAAGAKIEGDAPQWLREFAAKHRKRFEFADWLDELAPDDNRGSTATGSGTVFKCPNDDQHTNAGEEKDAGFFCINASESEGGSFVAKCHHDSCQGIDKLGFVGLICEAHSEARESMMRHLFREEGDADYPTTPPGADAGKVKAAVPNDYLNDHGKLRIARGDDDLPRWETLANAIELRGRIRNENREDWAKLFAFKDDGGVEHELILTDAEIGSDPTGTIAKLNRAGASIDAAKANHVAVVVYLSRVSINHDIVAVTRPGWHGSETYTSPLGEAFGLQADELRLMDGKGAADRDKGGTLEGWKDAAAAACGVTENPYWALGLFAGFAGCAVDLLEWGSVGLNYTGTTSTGKTTAQRLQASVAGNPRAGRSVFHNFKATGNSVENLIASGTGSTVALDELAHVDPREVTQAIFLLTGDGAKARQRADGTLRTQATWSTFFTLSGEMSIRQTIEAARQAYREGISTRVLDLSTAGGVTVPPETMALIEGCKFNYGWALPVFARRLIALGYATDPDKLAREIEALAGEIAGAGALPKLRRAARILAILRRCGEIAQGAGLLPAGLDVAGLVAGVWRGYLDGAGDTLEQADGGAEVALRLAVTEHWGDIADISGGIVSLDFRTRPAKGWRDLDHIYIAKGHLATLVGLGMSEDATAKALARKRLLARQSAKNLLHTFIPGLGGGLPHYRLARAFGPTGAPDPAETLRKDAAAAE